MCEATSSTHSHTAAVAVRLPGRWGSLVTRETSRGPRPSPPFDQRRLGPAGPGAALRLGHG